MKASELAIEATKFRRRRSQKPLTPGEQDRLAAIEAEMNKRSMGERRR
jgi:hypothetical protein